jgi:RecA-family ATPase
LSSIVSGTEYLSLPRAPETWLIESLLPVGGAMLLFGDPKVGKSYAALQLSACLSSGTPWLGFSIPQPVPVVYVQLDTPRSLWADRVQELVVSGHPLEACYFADRETLQTYPFDILNPEHFAQLTTALAPIKAGAVIIDTLRESHSGDENDSTEMQEVISHLDAAVKPAALILVSHARKSNPERGYDLMNDNRGSNYIVGRMDAICRFSKSSMRCTSRTLEEHSTKLERLDDGTWELADRDPFAAEAELLVQSRPTLKGRELARLLHDKVKETTYAKSEEACRAFLRRLQKG